MGFIERTSKFIKILLSKSATIKLGRCPSPSCGCIFHSESGGLGRCPRCGVEFSFKPQTLHVNGENAEEVKAVSIAIINEISGFNYGSIQGRKYDTIEYSEVHEEIMGGNIETAIDMLFKHFLSRDQEKFNNVLLLKARLKIMQREVAQGLITSQEKEVIQNKIITATLQICGTLEQ